MNIQLIKLQDKFKLVNDEEIKEGDWLIIDNEDVMQMKSSYDNDVSGEDIWVGDSLNGYATYKDNCKKIIAGIPELPSIDFSLLSEEDCKQIGWGDVWKLARFHYGENRKTREFEDGFMKGFKIAFKAAQSLNDKMFSLEDIDKAIEYGHESEIPFDKNIYNEFIQSLQQTSWDVEVEMKRETLYTDDGLDYKGDLRPKITNNSIKVLRIIK